MGKKNIDDEEGMTFVINEKSINIKLYINLKTLIFFFLFLIVLFIKFNFEFRIIEDKDSTQTYILGSNLFIKREVIYHFNKYIKICRKGRLIDKNIYNLSFHPKITVIMPIYNGGQYLYYSLRSIQNQQMKDIEIIIIDDCSLDDSLEIIEKYMEEDPRIRIIKNEKNRKILYSKSMAVLNAKGKYILVLDQDDMFISDDAFETLYNIAENKKLDLLQFRNFNSDKLRIKNSCRSINSLGGWIFSYEKINYKIQPELKNSFFKNYNFLLWGLLIKTDIYKKAVNKIWKIIINYKMALFEDYEITFFILLYSKNFYFVNYFYILHLFHQKSVTFSYYTEEKNYLTILFSANNFFSYHLIENPEDITMAVNFIADYKKDMLKIRQLYPELTNLVIKYFMYNNILTYEEKKKILEDCNLSTKDYKIWNTYEYYMNLDKYNDILSYQKLINYNNYKISKNDNILNPKISIIIYCNEYKYIQRVINSVENQNFHNYEIILVYDKNIKNKNESEPIETFTENYNNIKILINKEEKGLLYSYSRGILESKGEYILTFGSGYTLATNNILTELNNQINDDDIVEFNLLTNNQEMVTNNSLNLYKCLHFKSNINIDLLKFNERIKPLDLNKELLENKIIKAKLYKNIINEYKNLFDNKLDYYYDNIIMFLFNKKNIKINHIPNLGLIQYTNIVKLLDEKMKKNIIKDAIFYFNFLFDHSNNTIEDKMQVLYEFFDNLNIMLNNKNPIDEKIKILISKFLNCPFISDYNKNLLIFYSTALTS